MNLIPEKPTSYPVPLFSELTMMVFGYPGSGKTTFSADCPNTLVIGTEPGQDFTTAAVSSCYNWQTFINIITEIKQKRAMIYAKQLPISACPYSNFVIDIVDNLANQCRDYICEKKKLKYPPQTDFGKTWSEITAEWKRQLTQLMVLGNVKFISHCTTVETEIKDERGMNMEIQRLVPTFSGSKSAQFLDGIVNAVGHAFVDGSGNHYITFQQSAKVGAKDRTGILSKCSPIPLTWDDANRAYENQAKIMKLEVISKRERKKQ